MIDPIQLDTFKNKGVMDTSNERIKISTEAQLYFNDPDFKVLGFIGDRMFVYTANYLSKYTSDGKPLLTYYVEVESGTFDDNVPFFYVYRNRTVYKFSHNLELKWYIEVEEDIRQIQMDSAGYLYIIFERGRSIVKYSPEGRKIMYLLYETEPEKVCRLQRIFISSGRTFLFVAGSIFDNKNKRKDFIAKYNTITGKCLSDDFYNSTSYSNPDDETNIIRRLHVSDEVVYVEGYNFIRKMNKKLITKWIHTFGYNEVTGETDKLVNIEYDNTSFGDYIYFCEDLHSSFGYSFGKMDKYGNVLWRYIHPENEIDPKFSIAIDDEFIYTWGREPIGEFTNSILSLNNNTFLFVTEDGHLVRLIEYNKEIYDSSFYGGSNLVGDFATRDNPEFIFAPLLYQERRLGGYIIDENGNNILLTAKNKMTLNDEDYIYKRLIGDLEDYAERSQTYITTTSGMRILTSQGNRLVTTVPYAIKLTYDTLTDSLGNIITDLNGNELETSNGRPVLYFGLLADYFKMYAHLVTKKRRIPILTKKKKKHILKKQPIMYKYIFRKLKDISLLVEFLVQNNIISTIYPKYIENLRRHTFNVLNRAHANAAPCYFDMKTAKVDHFTYDAQDIYIDKNYQAMFLVKNMPFNKKKEYQPLDIRSMAEMVIDDTITPFLFFVNGHAIKWTDMTIVRDWHDTYIVIDNMNDDTVYSDKTDCILLPCTIRYGEDNNIEELSEKGLYFTDDGYFTTNIEKIGIRLEVIDDDVYSESSTITPEQRYFEVNLEKDKLSSERNILVFEEGLFDSDFRFYLNNSGYNIYGYEHDADNVVFRTFFYLGNLVNKDMILNVPNKEALKSEARELVLKEENAKYLRSMTEPFDFRFDLSRSYAENVARAIEYIATYDVGLFKDLFKDLLRIVDIKERDISPTSNRCIIPKLQRENNLSCCLLFTNGLFSAVEIDGNDRPYSRDFAIDCSAKQETDRYEVIVFSNYNNGSYNFSANLPDSSMPPHIVEKSVDPIYLQFDGVNYKEVDCETKHNYDENGNYKGTKVTPKVPTSNMVFTLCSDRQYHLFRFITFPSVVPDAIPLPTEFNYATRTANYLVFINGKLYTNWEIEARNGWMFMILKGTENFPVNDVLNTDVVYVPESYELFDASDIIERDGESQFHVKLPDEFVEGIPFNTTTYMVFVDGCKIPSEWVISGSRRVFHIPQGGSDVKVLKFGNTDRYMKEIMDMTKFDERWSNASENIPLDKMRELFKK